MKILLLAFQILWTGYSMIHLPIAMPVTSTAPLLFLPQRATNYSNSSKYYPKSPVMEYNTDHISVKLDHFNYFSNTTFPLRILYNNTYWKKPGPVFIVVGDEEPIDLLWSYLVGVQEYAIQFNASVIYVEHRFVGQSIPQSKFNGLLNVPQAFNDLAQVLTKLRQNYTTECPFIVFGKYYGGFLAANLRIKLPNLVDGAIASSALLNLQILSSQYNSSNYMIQKQYSNCIGYLNYLLQNISNQTNFNLIKDELPIWFHLCSNLTGYSKTVLLLWVESSLSSLAMYNYPFETNIVQNIPENVVDEACNIIEETKGSFEGLFEVMELWYGNYQEETNQCFNYETYATKENDPFYIWRQLSCTDFVLENNFFFDSEEWNLNEWQKECANNFGESPIRMENLYNYFGSNTPALSEASNMFLYNWEFDLFETFQINASKYAYENIEIEYLSEGYPMWDLMESRENDPQTIKNIRQKETELISQWILEKEIAYEYMQN